MQKRLSQLTELSELLKSASLNFSGLGQGPGAWDELSQPVRVVHDTRN